jgi:SAM-dependent methyltransferase
MPDDRLGGWIASASAYTNFQDAGDPNRTLLLDPVMLRLCGDVAGARVLDLGCGEGRFSRMLTDRGARCTGIDVTREMCLTARRRDASGNAYAMADAAHLPFAGESFDVVVSYVTLVDIPDYRAAIAEAARVLRPGGAMAVANLGFVTASARTDSGWIRDDQRNRLYYAIDRYAEERSMWYEWLGIRIENYHRPLAHYMSAYLETGLTLRVFEEPVPTDQSLREDGRFEDWFRVPLFTAMRWEKSTAVS